jgi:hypothetical protein
MMKVAWLRLQCYLMVYGVASMATLRCYPSEVIWYTVGSVATPTMSSDPVYGIGVRDLLDLVHNVVLIKCIFRSGNPGGSGFWVKGSSWATEGTKGVSLRATGSRGGWILTQQGGFQVSRQGEQGEQGEQGADRVYKVNYIPCMYAMNERYQLCKYSNNNRNECCC